MAGLRLVLVGWLAILWIDATSAAWFFGMPWVSVLVAGAGIAGVIRVSRSRQHPDRVTGADGWTLGTALEISNPDAPTFVQTAQIPAQTLRLGLLAIGGPGAGKTESVLLGYLNKLSEHSPGSGVAVFEGKGDIDIYKKCVAMGSAPDYFFSTELPGSDTINLMQGEPSDVVDRMTRLLIGHTVSTSFYADAQRAVLAAVIPLLTGLKVPVNLRDLYTALSVPDAGVELLRRARDIGVDPTVIHLAEQWFNQKPEQRLGEIRGLLNKLFIFCHGPATDRLNAYAPDIVISDVVGLNRQIYFHMPLSEFTRDVAIAIVDMFGVEARRRQLAGPEQFPLFPLLMDDWGGFFYDGFGPFSARCRSAAMPLSFSFQSLAQVKAVSQVFADELDDNLATKIIMRVQGEDTAAYALRLLGDYEAMEVSTSQLDDRDGTALGVSSRARINARDLRQLLEGEAYVSTLYPSGQQMKNPLWRLRLPLPEFRHWQSVPMPAARHHREGQGLGLWLRYMNAKASVTSTTHAAAKRRPANTEAVALDDFQVVEL